MLCTGYRLAPTTMTYRLKPDLLLQSVADEAVILDPASGRYYTLDDVGSRMIALLQEHGSIDPVVERIVREYRVEPDRARSDLQELLEQMAGEGLVERDPPG